MMASHPFGSGRDPITGLSHVDQLDTLRTMYGEPEPPRTHPTLADLTPTTPTFTPVSGTLDDTREPGRLFWTGPKWPEWAPPTPPNAETLHVLVAHSLIDGSRRPKKPETAAQLRKQIDTYGPRCGVYSLPLSAEPSRWTLQHIQAITKTIAALLPQEPDDTKVLEPDFTITARRHPYELTVTRGYGWRAYVELEPTDSLARFCATHGSAHDHECAYGSLSALLRLTGAPAARPQDDDDADDDLDTFEKAARRRLHGENAIPNTSRSTQQPAATERDRKIAAICRGLPKCRDYYVNLFYSLVFGEAGEQS